MRRHSAPCASSRTMMRQRHALTDCRGRQQDDAALSAGGAARPASTVFSGEKTAGYCSCLKRWRTVQCGIALIEMGYRGGNYLRSAGVVAHDGAKRQSRSQTGPHMQTRSTVAVVAISFLA